MNEFVFKNQKKLRCGLTTGTCAAACAQAAMLQLLTGQVLSEVSVRLPESRKNPENTRVTLAVYPTEDGGFATRKDAGDDPDVTNGTEIRAYIQVCERTSEKIMSSGEDHLRSSRSLGHGVKEAAGDMRMNPEAAQASSDERSVSVPAGAFVSADGRLYLTGGEGVGRVTKPGLEQAVGQSAINRVPRQMIFDAVQQVLDAFGEDDEKHRIEGSAAESVTAASEMEDEPKSTDEKQGVENLGLNRRNEGNEQSERSKKTCYLITISVPAGAELARRTFNPMLGIEGGISILGTTGIVEPMSEAAIVATIETSIRQVLAMEDGDIDRRMRRILAVPGNYGQRYVEESLRLSGVPVVEVSNYIGEAIDLAVSYGATEFLLVGNVGKLVKLAAGIMNTHSRVADGRWEIFAAHLALCGGTRVQVAAMREATTTEEMLTRLEEMGLRAPVMASIMGEIEAHMAHRIRGQMNFGVIVYSERFGRVGETTGAEELLEGFRMQGLRSEQNGN